MIKNILPVLVFVMVFPIFAPDSSFSQATGGGAGAVSPNAPQSGAGAPAVDTPQAQPDARDYMMFAPSDSLNPYGLSSMGGSTEVDYRDAAGTLGTKSKRPSNVEVNKALEQVKEEQVDETGEAPGDSFIEADVVNQAAPRTSGRHMNIYRWTDENGVLHVTNDLGTVPPEYQEQAVRDLHSGHGFNE